MSLLKVALVGCGHMGNLHARKLAMNPCVQLIGMVDPDLGRAENLAALCECEAYSSIAEVVAAADAIIIATPTRSHAALAMLSMGAGADVFIEKPMCETLKEANGIVQCANHFDRVVQIGHIQRFHPAIMCLKEIVEKPQYIETRRLTRYRGRGGDDSVILDLMIHDIDIALMLVKSPVKTIRVAKTSVITSNCDLANTRVEFENGAVLNATASRVSSIDLRTMKVYQKNLSADIDYGAKTIHTRGLDNITNEILFENRDELADELDAFVSSCLFSTKSPVSAEKGRDALKIALALDED